MGTLNAITENQHAALKRLFLEAKQDCHVASFLLAWWRPQQYGGFALIYLPEIERPVASDMATIFDLFANNAGWCSYFGFEADFKALERRWCPGPVEENDAAPDPLKRRRNTRVAHK